MTVEEAFKTLLSFIHSEEMVETLVHFAPRPDPANVDSYRRAVKKALAVAQGGELERLNTAMVVLDKFHNLESRLREESQTRLYQETFPEMG